MATLAPVARPKQNFAMTIVALDASTYHVVISSDTREDTNRVARRPKVSAKGDMTSAPHISPTKKTETKYSAYCDVSTKSAEPASDACAA